MKKIILLVLIILPLFVSGEEIEFKRILTIESMPMGINNCFFIDGRAYINGGGYVFSNYIGTSVPIEFPFKNDVYLMGQEGKWLLVTQMVKEEGKPLRSEVFWYNPQTEEKKYVNHNINYTIETDQIYYQNNKVFFALYTPIYEEATFLAALDYENGKQSIIKWDNIGKIPFIFPSAISPDKRSLLLGDSSDFKPNEIIVFNTEMESPQTIIKESGAGHIIFLTNNLFFFFDPNGESSFYNIEGHKLGKLRIIVKEDLGYYIFFTPDLKHAITTSDNMVILLDTSPLRDYLDERGFLFHKTRGKCNDSDVRIRINPNLKARIVGVLQKNDEVAVVDRSGEEVAIGNMKDYWYKVETKDGKTGWSYGAFIDVAAPRALGPAPIIQISASSTLTDPLDKNMYQPIKAFDGKPDTAWVENAAGPGVGQILRV